MQQTLSPIDRLTEQFGERLERICNRHKTLMLACLSYQVAHAAPMSDVVDVVDPNAYLPHDLTEAIISLDCLTEADYLNLIESLIQQLRSKVR